MTKNSRKQNLSDQELINPQFDERGYIQVYTGDGKGKTTASLGLTMRALGRGWNVLIVMFTKGGTNYGELYSFKELMQNLSNKLKIVQAGVDRIVYSSNINDEDQVAIAKGWDIAKDAAKSNEYKLIVLDEINIAIDLGLIEINDVKDFLQNKPLDLEIVMTGRRAHPEIVEIAHLVSEIKPIKHYWDIGIPAREGIEF
ncbi:MAG: cob(I)yrinic acid a,c-diamide adenosyltransferase [bacterium]